MIRSGRRRSICLRQHVTIEEVEDIFFDARVLLSDIDAAMRKLEEKRIITVWFVFYVGSTFRQVSELFSRPAPKRKRSLIALDNNSKITRCTLMGATPRLHQIVWSMSRRIRVSLRTFRTSFALCSLLPYLELSILKEQWRELRFFDAFFRFLKADITPLPYANDRMPKQACRTY